MIAGATAFALALRGAGAPESLTGRVIERRYAGTATFYLVRLEQGDRNGAEVEVAAGPSAAGPGDRVGLVPGEAEPHPRVFRAQNPEGPSGVSVSGAETTT